MSRQRVLFVCTHNSARSQMAEGMLRAWADERFEAASAGTERTSVRPEAIVVMRELGIDISAHRSKTIKTFSGRTFDRLITVCDSARQNCPLVPGVAVREHWSIDDPSMVEGSDEQRLAAFRRARDEIAERMRTLMATAGGVRFPRGGTPELPAAESDSARD